MSTPASFIEAIATVLRDAPSEGVCAVEIREEMSERWPGSFPYVTVIDIADQLPLMATLRG